MGLFGGGNSSSSTTNTQETQDTRITAAQNSTNIQNTRGVINGDVNVLDGGAISDAFNFAQNIAQGAADTANNAQATLVTAMQAVKSAYANENQTLSDAYSTAKAGEQKVMVAGALALVAIVVIKVLGKS